MGIPNWSAFSPMLGEVNLLDIDPNGPGPFALAGLSTSAHMGRASYYADIIEGWDPVLGAGEFMFVQATASIAPGQLVQLACSQDSNNNLVMSVTPWTGTANAAQDLGVAISSIGQGCWGWVQINGFAIADIGTTSAGATISSITLSGLIATVTTSTAHGRSVGDTVTLSGVTPSQYNGSYVITGVPSTTTFTIGLSVNNTPAGNASVVGSYVYYAGGASPTPNTAAYFSAAGAALGTVVASKQILGAQWATGSGATLGTGASAKVLPAYQAVLYLGRPVTQSAIT